MSSLPHISHKLFAAATNPVKPPPSTVRRESSAGFKLADIATAIPLELLDYERPMPSGVTRPLRAEMHTATVC